MLPARHRRTDSRRMAHERIFAVSTDIAGANRSSTKTLPSDFQPSSGRILNAQRARIRLHAPSASDQANRLLTSLTISATSPTTISSVSAPKPSRWKAGTFIQLIVE